MNPFFFLLEDKLKSAPGFINVHRRRKVRRCAGFPQPAEFLILFAAGSMGNCRTGFRD
jgi:hypothetical protein